MSSDPELEALFHESAQLHETIERLTGRVLGLFGVVLPVAIGVLGVLAAGADEHSNLAIASVTLVGVVSLVAVYAGSIWSNLLTYIQYKYEVLYPAIYAKVNRTTENLLQYMESRPALRGGAPHVLFICLFLALTAGFAGVGIYSSHGTLFNGWSLLVVIILAIPTTSSVMLLRRVQNLYRTIGRTRD